MKINYDQILIGQDKHGTIITADIKEGKITCINDYVLISSEESYDGNNYITCWGCGGEAEVNGVVYGRGTELSEDHTPFFNDNNVKEIILNEDYYEVNGHTCSDCGIFHDTEQYGNVSYTILNDCELYCKTCVGADDLISETPVHSVDDIYKAKDIVGLDPEEFEEVETIFHDCGWGGPATNHRQATIIVDDLLEEHGELFAALTGIGQFQVYVTLYKRREMAQTA